MGLPTGEFRAVALALASAGASILGPFAWVAVFRGSGFGTRAAALLLALGCLLYAATCSLGFNAGARETAAAEVLGRSETAADRRAVRTAARLELAGLATAKPAPTVLARRRELAKLLAAPAADTTAPVAHADPQAASVGFVLRAFGWDVNDQAVGQWLGLGTVAFLELAAALSLTVASALRPIGRKPAHASGTAAVPAGPDHTPAPEPARPTPPEAATEALRRDSTTADDGGKDDPPAPPSPPRRQSGRKGGRPATVLPGDVLDKIKIKGGRLSGSLAGIGRDIGVAKSSLHRVLKGLADAGRVHLTTTPAGVRVALA
jgi:hypothetical protein